MTLELAPVNDIEEDLVVKVAAQFPSYEVGLEIPEDAQLKGRRVIALQMLPGYDRDSFRREVGFGINVFSPSKKEAADIAWRLCELGDVEEVVSGMIRRITVNATPIKVPWDITQRITSYYLAIDVRVRAIKQTN